MLEHTHISKRDLHKKIADGSICFAGNIRLKIYGTLNCRAGKRMNKKNRVFFTSEIEALSFGFRPCGRCLPAHYRDWKSKR
jgi:methylphosphotriester-DNA--protein-cysteine methyltransferase